MPRLLSILWFGAWLWLSPGCGDNHRSTAPEFAGGNTPREEYLAGFADANLAEAVRQALGKEQGSLETRDFLAVTQLRATGYYVKDLSGLERLSNLEVLELPKSRLTALDPLSRLVNLRELDLAHNQIVELSPLSALRNLRRLDLEGNQVQDISPLTGLYSLSWVELSGNPLSALSQNSLITQLRAQKVEVLFSPLDLSPRRETIGDPAKVKVLFTTYRDGNAEIYGIDGDDGSLVNLTQNPAEDTEPAWAPDGTRFAFVSDRDRGQGIYVQGLGSTAQLLVTGSAPKSELAWSPDGSYLAYTDVQGGASSVQVVSTQTGALVWGSDPTVGALSPAWSPDSRRLVYSAYHGGHRALHIVQITDGLVNTLNSGSGNATTPAWSPDGAQIAFVSDQSGDQEVYLIEAGGSPLHNLSQDPGTDVLPSWSPDGQELAFVSDRWGSPEIFLVTNDGSQAEQETHLGVVALSAPVWSGDGTKLLFETNTEGNFEVYILDRSGQTLDNLSLDPGEDTGPCIQPSFETKGWTSYQVELAAPFADPGLEAAVRTALGNREETLLRSQVLRLEQLDASQKGIVDLGGIDQLENLRWLVLADNQVSDLGSLARLDHLENLDLENNRVRELAPLTNLKRLQYLNLNFNLVKDLSPLLGLDSLRSVELLGNPLDSTQAMTQLAGLKDRGVQLTVDTSAADSVVPPATESFAFSGPKLAVVVMEKGSGRYAWQQEIYLVSPDGQQQVNLSRESTIDDWAPAWSPDGTHLAFCSSRGVDLVPNLYTVDLASGQITPLTQGGGYIDPSWSPDGRQLVYVRQGKQLWVMDADGRNTREIFRSEDDLNGPIWSPDGSHIAFLKYTDLGSQVFVVAVAGGQVWRADSDTGGDRSYAGFAWQPSNGDLLIDAVVFRGDETESTLYLVDMEQQHTPLLSRSGKLGPPAWTPEGSRLAFAADFDGGENIFVLTIQGLSLSNLTHDGNAGYNVAWSPDGHQLAYSAGQLGSAPDHVLVMDVQGNGRQEVFSRAAEGGVVYGLSWAPKF